MYHNDEYLPQQLLSLLHLWGSHKLHGCQQNSVITHFCFFFNFITYTYID